MVSTARAPATQASSWVKTVAAEQSAKCTGVSAGWGRRPVKGHLFGRVRSELQHRHMGHSLHTETGNTGNEFFLPWFFSPLETQIKVVASLLPHVAQLTPWLFGHGGRQGDLTAIWT